MEDDWFMGCCALFLVVVAVVMIVVAIAALIALPFCGVNLCLPIT